MNWNCDFSANVRTGKGPGHDRERNVQLCERLSRGCGLTVNSPAEVIRSTVGDQLHNTKYQVEHFETSDQSVGAAAIATTVSRTKHDNAVIPTAQSFLRYPGS